MEDEYDCEDATCIAAELECNGKANCRFRWDEDDTKCNVSSNFFQSVLSYFHDCLIHDPTIHVIQFSDSVRFRHVHKLHSSASPARLSSFASCMVSSHLSVSCKMQSAEN